MSSPGSGSIWPGRGKTPDDVIDSLGHQVKFHEINTARPEGDGEVHFGPHLHVLIRRQMGAFHTEAEQHCIVVEWSPCGYWTHRRYASRWMVNTNMAWVRECGVRYPVLIGIGELSHLPQRVAFHHAFVWLVGVDDCPVRVRYTSEQTFTLTPFTPADVINRIDVDREASSFGWLCPRQPVNEVIQSGVEVTDDFSSKDAQADGRLLTDYQPDDVPAALDLKLFWDGIRAGTHEESGLILEGFEVLDRAPVLKSGTVEAVRHA